MIKKTINIFLAFLLVSCLFQAFVYNIEGRVIYRGEPVSDCIVQFDSLSVFSDITGNDGSFSINGLTNGIHSLSLHKNLDSNEYIGLKKEIRIDTNTDDINTYFLFEPLNLANIDLQESDNEKIILKWYPGNKSDIVGYKLISKEDAPFDREKVRIVYESTDPEDTVCYDYGFSDDIKTNYQLISYYQNGSFAASKIISVIADKMTYIKNGDFEEEVYGDSIPRWDRPSFFYYYFNLVDDVVFNGRYSLEATTDRYEDLYDYRILQEINLSEGNTYKLSLMMKTSENTRLSAIIYTYPRYEEIFPKIFLSPEQGWTEKSVEFTVPSISCPLYLELGIYSQSRIVGRGWFDDIKIELLED